MRRLASFAVILVASTLTPACAKQSPAAGSLGTRPGGGEVSRAEAGPETGPAGGWADGGWADGRKGGSHEAEAPSPAAPVGSAADGAWGATRSWDEAPRRDAVERRIVEDSRPGLGTAYGETRSSSVETVSLRRADPDRPEVVFTLRYDDADGIRAAAARHHSRAWSDEALLRSGGLAFAVLDASGEVLPAATLAGEVWAVGQVDARYSLAIANDTGSAFEVVASVDGLDVIDGRPASFSKRGYIVDPFSSVVIDGWRTSEDTVAAFRFSSVDDSYADRMGDGRNVGVIGAAFFREAPPPSWERERWSPPPEHDWRRDSADPFPGR